MRDRHLQEVRYRQLRKSYVPGSHDPGACRRASLQVVWLPLNLKDLLKWLGTAWWHLSLIFLTLYPNSSPQIYQLVYCVPSNGLGSEWTSLHQCFIAELNAWSQAICPCCNELDRPRASRRVCSMAVLTYLKLRMMLKEPIGWACTLGNTSHFLLIIFNLLCTLSKVEMIFHSFSILLSKGCWRNFCKVWIDRNLT